MAYIPSFPLLPERAGMDFGGMNPRPIGSELNPPWWKKLMDQSAQRDEQQDAREAPPPEGLPGSVLQTLPGRASSTPQAPAAPEPAPNDIMGLLAQAPTSPMRPMQTGGNPLIPPEDPLLRQMNPTSLSMPRDESIPEMPGASVGNRMQPAHPYDVIGEYLNDGVPTGRPIPRTGQQAAPPAPDPLSYIQEPQHARAVLDQIENPTPMGGANVTPQGSDLLELIGGRPNRDEYEPDMLRKVLAMIAGFGAGYSNPALGYELGRDIVDRPYNEAVADWQGDVDNRLNLEQIMGLQSYRDATLAQGRDRIAQDRDRNRIQENYYKGVIDSRNNQPPQRSPLLDFAIRGDLNDTIERANPDYNQVYGHMDNLRRSFPQFFVGDSFEMSPREWFDGRGWFGIPFGEDQTQQYDMVEQAIQQLLQQQLNPNPLTRMELLGLGR